MVKLVVPVAIAFAANLVSGVQFFLVTQQFLDHGKQIAIQNLLSVFDSNTAGLCNGDRYQGSCGVIPDYKDPYITTCTGNYTGTHAYKGIAGFFINKKGLFVTDGVAGADNKDGTNFGFNVTHDSRCKPYKCTINTAAGNTVNNQGFRCIA